MIQRVETPGGEDKQRSEEERVGQCGADVGGLPWLIGTAESFGNSPDTEREKYADDIREIAEQAEDQEHGQGSLR